ncbi:hypothetical protein [Variovorax saccharolyticus]|nr:MULTISPECIES: hypothetical protein [unclassified Variovorax]MDM0019214.1 hypothetical protein [Variovorax sp. J22R187]MDM0026084.1 hypothetical protein [Variovorax sp. J31P216]
MFRLTVATLLLVLAGCSGNPQPRQFSVCSTQPGSYACQVERMSNAGM